MVTMHVCKDYINPRVGESLYVSSVGEHVGYSSVGECSDFRVGGCVCPTHVSENAHLDVNVATLSV